MLIFWDYQLSCSFLNLLNSFYVFSYRGARHSWHTPTPIWANSNFYKIVSGQSFSGQVLVEMRSAYLKVKTYNYDKNAAAVIHKISQHKSIEVENTTKMYTHKNMRCTYVMSCYTEWMDGFILVFLSFCFCLCFCMCVCVCVCYYAYLSVCHGQLFMYLS